MTRNKDIVCGIIGIIFSLIVFALSVQIGLIENTEIGADFMPKIVSVIMLLLSAVLTLRGIKAGRQETKKLDYVPNYKGVLILAAGMIIYIMLLKSIGFVITSIVFLFFTLCIMTKKEETNYIKFAILSIVAVIIINFVFMNIFGIRIPQGIL